MHQTELPAPSMKKNKLPFILLAIYALVMCVLAFAANGTGDEGDSVFHYLFARYAFIHTHNFLDHWAKPLYVLLAAPFAQLGFVGVKLMNICFSTLSAWLVYLIAKHLQMPRLWAALLFALLAPMHIYLTLSGLTEPLFALWLITGVYLAVRGQILASVVWVSFLPFVRSEGLVVLCVWTLYLLSLRKWRFLPLLFTGHAAFALVGYFYYGSLLWVFTKIPYAANSAVYGSGKLLHFIRGLQEVIGLPMYILAGIGLLYGAVRLFKAVQTLSYKHISAEELWLIYGCFTAYIIAHTLFWYFGLFKSFGLLRVLVGIVPLSALICLRGMNALLNLTGHRQRLKTTLAYLIPAIVFAYTLFGNKWQQLLSLRADQRAQTEMAKYLSNRFEGYKYYFDAPYVGMLMNVDVFNSNVKEYTSELFTGSPIPEKSLIIWDDWYSPVEADTKLETLLQDSRFELLRPFDALTPWGSRRTTYVFTKRQFNIDSLNTSGKLTLFSSGFENEPSATANLDSLVAFEGKYATTAAAAAPYSLGFELPMNELEKYIGAVLKVEAQVFVPQKEPERYKEALLIISFENEKSYSWTPLHLQDFAPEGQWQYITLESRIPPMQTPQDHVNVYLYNLADKPVYLDNLLVQVVK